MLPSLITTYVPGWGEFYLFGRLTPFFPRRGCALRPPQMYGNPQLAVDKCHFENRTYANLLHALDPAKTLYVEFKTVYGEAGGGPVAGGPLLLTPLPHIHTRVTG